MSPSTACWPVPGVQLANQSVMAKDFIVAEEWNIAMVYVTWPLHSSAIKALFTIELWFTDWTLEQVHSTVFYEATYLPLLPDFSVVRVPSLNWCEAPYLLDYPPSSHWLHSPTTFLPWLSILHWRLNEVPTDCEGFEHPPHTPAVRQKISSHYQNMFINKNSDSLFYWFCKLLLKL